MFALTTKTIRRLQNWGVCIALGIPKNVYTWILLVQNICFLLLVFSYILLFLFLDTLETLHNHNQTRIQSCFHTRFFFHKITSNSNEFYTNEYRSLLQSYRRCRWRTENAINLSISKSKWHHNVNQIDGTNVWYPWFLGYGNSGEL